MGKRPCSYPEKSPAISPRGYGTPGLWLWIAKPKSTPGVRRVG